MILFIFCSLDLYFLFSCSLVLFSLVTLFLFYFSLFLLIFISVNLMVFCSLVKLSFHFLSCSLVLYFFSSLCSLSWSIVLLFSCYQFSCFLFNLFIFLLFSIVIFFSCSQALEFSYFIVLLFSCACFFNTYLLIKNEFKPLIKIAVLVQDWGTVDSGHKATRTVSIWDTWETCFRSILIYNIYLSNNLMGLNTLWGSSYWTNVQQFWIEGGLYPVLFFQVYFRI